MVSRSKPTTASPHRVAVAGAVAAGAGYSYLAAGTTPFTTEADVVTVVGFAAVGAVLVSGLVRRRRRAGPAAGGRLWPWALALAGVGLWEITTYVAGFPFGRHAFPTLSSLYDLAARTRAVKALCIAVWLALGFALVRA